MRRRASGHTRAEPRALCCVGNSLSSSLVFSLFLSLSLAFSLSLSLSIHLSFLLSVSLSLFTRGFSSLGVRSAESVLARVHRAIVKRTRDAWGSRTD